MRRSASIVLFVVGGWILAGETFVAGFDLGERPAIVVAMLAFMAALALPFLLLGTWISPGARWAELGLTLMIVAGLTFFCGIAMAAVMLDPAMKPLFPSDMPKMRFNWALGIGNLLVVGGTGFLLRQWGLGRSHGRARKALE